MRKFALFYRVLRRSLFTFCSMAAGKEGGTWTEENLTPLYCSKPLKARPKKRNVSTL